MPRRPSSPISGHRSRGNLFERSMSSARGAMRSWAKFFTLSRKRSLSAPRPKSKPGQALAIMVSLVEAALYGPTSRLLGLLRGVFQTNQRGERARNGRRNAACLRRDVGFDDGERAAGAHHLGAGDKALAQG